MALLLGRGPSLGSGAPLLSRANLGRFRVRRQMKCGRVGRRWARSCARAALRAALDLEPHGRARLAPQRVAVSEGVAGPAALGARRV